MIGEQLSIHHSFCAIRSSYMILYVPIAAIGWAVVESAGAKENCDLVMKIQRNRGFRWIQQGFSVSSLIYLGEVWVLPIVMTIVASFAGSCSLKNKFHQIPVCVVYSISIRQNHCVPVHNIVEYCIL